MNKLPENIVNKIYRFEHEMSYSKVMNQLKTYRLNTVFIVSIEFWNMVTTTLVEFVHHVLTLIVLMQHLMKYYV